MKKHTEAPTDYSKEADLEVKVEKTKYGDVTRIAGQNRNIQIADRSL